MIVQQPNRARQARLRDRAGRPRGRRRREQLRQVDVLKLIAELEEPDAGTSVRRRGIVVSFLPQHPLGDEQDALETVRAARPDLDELDRDLHRVADQLARTRRRPRPDDARASPPGGARRGAGKPRARSEHRRPRPRDAARPRHRRGRPDAADERALRRATEAGRARGVPRPGSRRPAARRARGAITSTPLGARCSSGCSRPSTAPPSRSRTTATCSTRRSARSPSSHRGRGRMWPGNYSAYTLARELELQRQQQQFVTQQKEIERLEASIRQFKDWAHRVVDERHIKQARNKQRQIDRMEKVERPVLERHADRAAAAPAPAGRSARLRAPPGRGRVRRRRRPRRRRPDRRPRRASRLRRRERRRQERAAQDGRRRARADRGRGLGRPLDRDRLSGAGSGDARSRKSSRSRRSARPPLHRGEAVALLMKFLFPYEQVRRCEQAPLGRRAHAAAAAAADAQQPNLLVLDEPTNHLDIDSVEALERRWRSSRARSA